MAMNQILVSVIIPVYNVEKYLSQCIESIVCQNFSSLEVILINDGSSDHSLDICHYYASLDQRVKLIDKKNEGVGPARNDGLKIARGKYIYFLDSDDFVEPYFFDSLTPYLDGRFDIIQFGFNRVNQSGSFLNSVIPKNIEIFDLKQEKSNLVEILDSGVGLALWEKLIKRSLIEEYDIIFDNKKRGEDYTFISKVFDKSGGVISVKKAIINYRQLFNVSRKFDENIIENHIDNFFSFKKIFDQTPDRSFYVYLDKIFSWWFFIVIPLTVSSYSNLGRKEKIDMLKKMYENNFLKEYLIEFNEREQGFFNKAFLFVFNNKLAGFHLLFGVFLRKFRRIRYK